ncbi:MAG: hypothetical protein ABI472_12925 [Ginsengibacter sp.]
MKNILLGCLVFFFACNSTDQNEKDSNERKADSGLTSNIRPVVPNSVSGCYSWDLNKDSARLQLAISGTEVTGNLKYYLFQKDKNIGTLQGRLQDSIVVAAYTFQSEGTTSVREVVFKIRGETLVEGYGDIIMHGDTAIFKNKSGLRFQDTRPFKKVLCR